MLGHMVISRLNISASGSRDLDLYRSPITMVTTIGSAAIAWKVENISDLHDMKRVSGGAQFV